MQHPSRARMGSMVAYNPAQSYPGTLMHGTGGERTRMHGEHTLAQITPIMLISSPDTRPFQTALGDSVRQLLPGPAGRNPVGRNQAVGRSQAAGQKLVLAWAGRNQAVGRNLIVGRILQREWRCCRSPLQTCSAKRSHCPERRTLTLFCQRGRSTKTQGELDQALNMPMANVAYATRARRPIQITHDLMSGVQSQYLQADLCSWFQGWFELGC